MKAWLEILRVAVFNKDDARTPTKLTVSYKGWWHSPLLHVPLAMEPLKDGIHTTRKDSKITLIQRFPGGKAPTFRVKGRNNKLEIRLYAGKSLRTRAKVRVRDLVSGTAERVIKVPFEDVQGGKVEKAFLSVVQISPVATPPSPPVYPVGYKRVPNPAPLCTFPLGEYEPTEDRLKFLVEAQYGPWPDPKEWLLPPSHISEDLREEATSTILLDDCETNSVSEAAITEEINTNCVTEDERTIKTVLNTTIESEPVMHLDTDSGEATECYSSDESDQDSSQGREDDSLQTFTFPLISYLRNLFFVHVSSMISFLLFGTSENNEDGSPESTDESAGYKHQDEGEHQSAEGDASNILLWNELFGEHCENNEDESTENSDKSAVYKHQDEGEHEGLHQSAEGDASYMQLWNEVFGEH